MSEIDAADNSSDEPKSQMSTRETFSEKEKPQVVSTDMWPAELESHASSTDKGSGEESSHKSAADESIVEEKEQVIAMDKPELQTGTTNRFGKQESLMPTTDHSSGEPQSQVDTTNKSLANEKPQRSSTDQYLGEPPSSVNTTDKSSGEEKLQVKATDNSSGAQNPQMSAKEILQVVSTNRWSGEPESYTSSADRASDQPHMSAADVSTGKKTKNVNAKDEPESQTSTTDRSGEQESEVATGDCSDEPESEVGIPSKGFANEKPQISTGNEYLDEPESTVSTTDRSSGEKSQEDFTDRSSGEKSQEDFTDRGFGESQLQTKTTDKSSGRPESHMGTPNMPSGKDIVMDKASGAASVGKATGEPEPQGSNIDEEPLGGGAENQDVNEDESNLLRHRGTLHSKSPPVSEPESHMGGTPRSSKQESQADIATEEKCTARSYWLIGFAVLVLFFALVFLPHLWEGQPPIHQNLRLKIFFKEVASLKKDFPGQYEGLWFRSEKILQKHLNMTQPSSPSILILTAAQDAEWTLRCMSKRLAKSYANSLNASWLMVDGLSKSNYDSATSKMQIDKELSTGFQSTSRAAVLHRLEMLPAGSLLILYKYCDHENAAFKNVALVLTVLLQQYSLETDLSFSEVEEKVKDLLWERFASSEVSAHNEMDVDKLSGVWSRISHIVLPVLPVGPIESGSCPGLKD